MTVIDFDEFIGFRIKKSEIKKLKKVIKKNKTVYLNLSHFIRCAVIKLLREYDEDGRKKHY